jgi:hypothetical protein
MAAPTDTAVIRSVFQLSYRMRRSSFGKVVRDGSARYYVRDGRVKARVEGPNEKMAINPMNQDLMTRLSNMRGAPRRGAKTRAGGPCQCPAVRGRMRIHGGLSPGAPRGEKNGNLALGTTSSDFVNATLVQIQNASRMPSGGISETSVNAVLALIEAAEPKNEIKAALAIQMACTHAVAMAVLSRAGGAYGGDRHVALLAAAGARLLRAFAAQVDAMRRLRNGGTQVIRVERIEVSDTAQAIIGNVNLQRQ